MWTRRSEKIIIIEGSDNSGKTTLVSEICERFPDLIPLKSKGPKSDYDFWMGILTRSPEYLSRLVCDRFFYSELVYGPLVRGKVSLTVHQQEVVHSMLVSAEPFVIRCHLIMDEEKFNSRPQLFDWETTLKTEELFDQILGSGVVFHYWPLGPHDLENPYILRRVAGYMVLMNQWKEFRSKIAYGRGQMLSPRLMLVGEKFSSNNTWMIPFERSKSGIALHNALRKTGFPMEELWFTNAVKTSEPLNPINLAVLKREVELIEPQTVVGLGNRASGLLSMIGVEHVKIKHPGYYLRKYSTAEANQQFADEFATQIGWEIEDPPEGA